jgi:hypothetical protein
MWNYQGLNPIFLLIMLFSGITGSSAIWLIQDPGIFPALALITSFIGSIFAFKAYYQPSYKYTNIKLTSKIDLLKSVETDLKKLIKFIQDQRGELSTNEKILTDLKKEHNQLKPIIESERDLVNGIIDQVTKMNRSIKIRGYIASFFLGFASSLLASYIFGIFKSN